MVLLINLALAADPAATTTSTATAIYDLDDDAPVGPTLKPEAVSETVGKYSWAVSECYRKNAVKDQSGRMTVEFAVKGDGTVTSSKLQASDLKNPALESCVVEAVKTMRFPATNGPDTAATFPFVF